MSAHFHLPRRGLRSTAAAVLAVGALLFAAAAPAYATPASPVSKYVALGDSYAAGQGAGAPLDSCLRSAAAYPVLLDAEPRINLLRTAACSGATIADVSATQLSQVNRGTTLVTLTVGANDLGAGTIYAVCSVDPGSAECAGAITVAQQTLESGVIAQQLAALLAAIAERAPNAQIIVSDYPVPFVWGVHWLGDFVDTATSTLNDQIAAAVAAAAAQGVNVELASVEFAYLGHQVGDGSSWLGDDPANALTFLHPTPVGQAVYRDAILQALSS